MWRFLLVYLCIAPLSYLKQQLLSTDIFRCESQLTLLYFVVKDS